MNEVDGELYSPDQSPTTPAVIPAKDSNVRPHGDMLKMMNPTPNGYSNVPNHKPKSEGQEVKKHHESKNNVDHHKHSSDHVKKKEDDSSKHKSSHSKPKEHSKEGKSENQSGHDKEKKHSSHSDSSKSKDSSNKHSDHSKHSSSVKKEEKHKSDSVKKEHHSSEGKPKTDNFKENEKIKDSSSKEKSKEHKEKHKDKHRDKEHKDKHKDKEHKEKHKDKSSSDKPKEKSDKPKEKSDKPKDVNAEKHKDKHSEKSKDREHGQKSKDKEHSDKHKSKEHSEKHKDKEHGEKHKDKEHSEKHKDKEHSEKHKDKEHGEKHKDKEHKEKHKDKHSEKHKEKIKEEKIKEEKIKEEKIKEEKVKEEKIKVENTEPLENESSPGRLVIKEEVKDDEPMSEEDIPLATRHASILANESVKREPEEIDSDDEPLSSRAKKMKTGKKKKPSSDDDEDYEMEKKPKKRKKAGSDDDDDYITKKPAKKVKKEKTAKATAKVKKEIKEEPPTQTSPVKKRGKKEEEEQEVWKWWEEEKLEDGKKWRTLEHHGPVFAPPYERVPKNVKFYYDGKHMELSELTEEVAGFYGRMLDHEYTSKDVFNTNFFKDWRKVMTPAEKEKITDLKKCNFNDFNVYYKMKSEERKNMTKEEKLVIKKENEELTKKYGFCIVDGHKQKIGNFKIEPPGLFRGRGEHPKMGMLKRRIEAEDVLINIGKEAKVPEAPPGHKWKEVRHDNTVSWLASWTENILGSTKYVMLNPSSKLKGEKDWQKYETARKLKAHAGRIRQEYEADFKSKEMKVRQRAVALYFIDKLALRAGNEKDEDTADTVGCCSLRVEHITLDDEKDGKEYVVTFDFLGKDSIRYYNSVAVEKRAYKNLKLFMENKQPGDDLFDRLNTSILNKYLNDLMEGLTAKVFRTYNASKTLQEQLELLTKEEMSIPEKILAYNRANRAVAILCNHQRAVPKGFSKAMENLKQKIDEKENQIKEFKKELKAAKAAAKDGGSKEKVLYDKKKKRLAQLEEQLKKLDVQAVDKEENKQIALGTSKLNYLDPRISVAWCKKWGVPIEKIYNRTQRDKFRWAIEMAGPDYKF